MKKSNETVLANCVIRMIKSECKLLGFLFDHPNAIREEYASDSEGKKYEHLKMVHDEDFCRVREMLREIKGDKDLLHC